MEGAIIGGLGIFAATMMFFVFVIAIAAVVFWIWSLVDALTRSFPEDYEKLVWVLVIIFTGIIGSVIYYFIGVPRGVKDSRTRKKTTTTTKTTTAKKTTKSGKAKKKGSRRKI
jgi:phosphotransferase system  glucose/maltose/N-acetylglucosamine-specific IIC component